MRLQKEISSSSYSHEKAKMFDAKNPDYGTTLHIPHIIILSWFIILKHRTPYSACWPGYLGVSVIHRTWTTGSLACVRDLFARVYARGTSVYSLITVFCRVCPEFDSGEISGRA